MMRHGPFPGSAPGSHLPVEPLDRKVAIQAAEIEQLAGDNHRLAASQVALRQDLVAAQQEIQRLRAHIRSIETESDIQIRVLLDKIAKIEVEIRAGEGVRKDLQHAHMEAKSLVTSNQELTAQIQQATEELDKVHADVKKLPEMLAELDNLRQEHQRLRTTFEYEKGLNIGKVQEMKTMERDLVGMVGEVEKLRALVITAENRAHAPSGSIPYGNTHVNSGPIYPHLIHGVGAYESYGRPQFPMTIGVAEALIPYGSANSATAPNGPPPPGSVGSSAWEGAFDAPLARR